MQNKSNQLDFSNQDIYVGIDVHKKNWTVSIMVDNILHRRFSLDASPTTLAGYLNRTFPRGRYHSVYEAGFCGFWVHRELQRLGIDSCVVSPADIPTSDKERKQKDDGRDSYKLVKSLKNHDMEAIFIPGIDTQEDRMLTRTREAIIKDLRRSKNRVKSMLYFQGIAIPAVHDKRSGYWSNRFIQWLEGVRMNQETGTAAIQSLLIQVKNNRKQVLELTRKIQQLAKSQRYADKVGILTTVPGVGMLSAMKILTEFETIHRFSSTDKLCSYIGLIPTTKSSGEKERTGNITPRGHHVLRDALIESAWTAIRVDPVMLLKYKELCKRMESNQAIVRISKKLVKRIAHVLRSDQPYEQGIVK
jgi:transposase